MKADQRSVSRNLQVVKQIPEWSSDLAKQAMQIEVLVDHLPDLTVTEAEQLKKMETLESANREAGEELLREVERTGKYLLDGMDLSQVSSSK